MMRHSNLVRTAILVLLPFMLSDLAAARTRRSTAPKSRSASKSSLKKVSAKASKQRATKGAKSRTVSARESAEPQTKLVRVRGKRGRTRLVRVAYDPNGPRIAGGPWLVPTFADSTSGDNVDGEDLVVRRAAVEALGPYNGTVVVVDPQTGRILSMVNQKLALSNGYQPCSTVKVLAGLAGLSERAIEGGTYVRVSHRSGMNLTNALALSNNSYFANIGNKLGYEKISYYGKLFGYGEKAGLNIESEQPGIWPDAPPTNGGMGMMTSFGEGISQTPLQLAALISAVANGGTLLYLQYPKSQAEADHLVPRVKRQLPIQNIVDEMKPGLSGAVQFGTARRAMYDSNEPVLGKTGTCTDSRTPTHLGWFASFNEVAGRKLAVVVLLTGGRPISGPVASGIAGQVYRNLSQNSYFAKGRSVSPVALIQGSSW